jgi:hypothetical protein
MEPARRAIPISPPPFPIGIFRRSDDRERNSATDDTLARQPQAMRTPLATLSLGSGRHKRAPNLPVSVQRNFKGGRRLC